MLHEHIKVDPWGMFKINKSLIFFVRNVNERMLFEKYIVFA